MEIGGIPKEDVERLWPVLEPFINHCLTKGSPYQVETPQDVYQELLSGTLQGWMTADEHGPSAVMTTYISETPLIRRATIKHIAGVGMSNWLHFYPLVEEWAKAQGAQQIMIYGRAGWARVLAEQGFHPDHVVLSKTL